MIVCYAFFSLFSVGVFAAPSTVSNKTMTARQDIRQSPKFAGPSGPNPIYGSAVHRNYFREIQHGWG